MAKGKKKMTATPDELRILYHEKMMSLAQIGVIFEVDSEVIRYHMKRHGIERRVSSSCPGNLNGSWSGGRTIDKDGYVLVHAPGMTESRKNGYMLEHRLVMTQLLGRPLLPTEVVHHKDGNKQNNHPVNLEIYGCNADHLKDELSGRIPNWSAEGKQRSLDALQLANHPAWTDERREKARQRMLARWEKDGIPRRVWDDEAREKMRLISEQRARLDDGSFA
jgi:hypothetical protein